MKVSHQEPNNLVTLEKTGDGVALLTVNNPPLNLFTPELTRAFDERLQEVGRDESTRCLVLTGAGDRAFGAGSDLKTFPELLANNTVVEKKLRYENEVYTRLEELPQPTIAMMKGVALGGGCEYALCCDFRIGAENLVMGLPEIKIGVYPGSGGIVRLPRLIGEARAKELMYLGNSIGARQALKWGLLHKVVPNKDLFQASMDWACEIATRPGKAIRMMKEMLRRFESMGRAEAIEYSLARSEEIFQTKDAQEGVKAFFEKRASKFEHY